MQHLADSGGVSQQMTHCRRPEAGLRGDQPVGPQVIVGGRIEVEQPLLPQLHHGDCGEGLCDGGDPKDRVLGDGRLRRDVGEPVSVEELKGSVADHSDRQTDGGPAVEDLVDSGLHPQLIDLGHGSPVHPARGTVRPTPYRRAPESDVAPIGVGRKEATGP